MILAEKYYTKNQSNSDYKMAVIKNMPVSHYQGDAIDAQMEFCRYFQPLDKEIDDEEYERRLQGEKKSAIRLYFQALAMREGLDVGEKTEIFIESVGSDVAWR